MHGSASVEPEAGFTNSVALTLDPDATLDVPGDLLSTGDLWLGDGSSLDLSGAFLNQGDVHVADASASINPASGTDNDGNLLVGADGALALAGTLTSSGTVSQGAAADLRRPARSRTTAVSSRRRLGHARRDRRPALGRQHLPRRRRGRRPDRRLPNDGDVARRRRGGLDQPGNGDAATSATCCWAGRLARPHRCRPPRRAGALVTGASLVATGALHERRRGAGVGSRGGAAHSDGSPTSAVDVDPAASLAVGGDLSSTGILAVHADATLDTTARLLNVGRLQVGATGRARHRPAPSPRREPAAPPQRLRHRQSDASRRTGCATSRARSSCGLETERVAAARHPSCARHLRRSRHRGRRVRRRPRATARRAHRRRCATASTGCGCGWSTRHRLIRQLGETGSLYQAARMLRSRAAPAAWTMMPKTVSTRAVSHQNQLSSIARGDVTAGEVGGVDRAEDQHQAGDRGDGARDGAEEDQHRHRHVAEHGEHADGRADDDADQDRPASSSRCRSPRRGRSRARSRSPTSRGSPRRRSRGRRRSRTAARRSRPRTQPSTVPRKRSSASSETRPAPKANPAKKPQMTRANRSTNRPAKSMKAPARIASSPRRMSAMAGT